MAELTPESLDDFLHENVRASLLLVKEFAAQHPDHGRVRLASSTKAGGAARGCAPPTRADQRRDLSAAPIWLRRRYAEQRAQRRERFFADAEVGPAAALLALDQAGLQQHLQVVADGRLAEAERLGQVADAGLAAGLGLDQAQQPQPRRVGDHLQRRGELLRVVCRRAAPAGAAGRRRRSSRSCCTQTILTAIDDRRHHPRRTSIAVDTRGGRA